MSQKICNAVDTSACDQAFFSKIFSSAWQHIFCCQKKFGVATTTCNACSNSNIKRFNSRFCLLDHQKIKQRLIYQQRPGRKWQHFLRKLQILFFSSKKILEVQRLTATPNLGFKIQNFALFLTSFWPKMCCNAKYKRLPSHVFFKKFYKRLATYILLPRQRIFGCA